MKEKVATTKAEKWPQNKSAGPFGLFISSHHFVFVPPPPPPTVCTVHTQSK
jgi:hypothetical protein